MGTKKMNLKNILIIILAVLIGFGAGMIVTFETVINKLEKHNIELKLD